MAASPPFCLTAKRFLCHPAEVTGSKKGTAERLACFPGTCACVCRPH